MGCSARLQGDKRLANKIPKIGKIPQKPFSGGVWGQTSSPKHLQGTIQSIWVTGFPIFWILEPFSKRNHVSQGPSGRGAFSAAAPRQLPGNPRGTKIRRSRELAQHETGPISNIEYDPLGICPRLALGCGQEEQGGVFQRPPNSITGGSP